jgi:predicted transposase/invertase (TIGR01784 family)
MENLRYLGEMSAARNQGYREGLEEAYRKSVERGYQKGQDEALRDITKRGLALHMSVDVISKATGLSVDEIEQLAAEIALEQGEPGQSQGGMNLSM